MSLWKVAWRSIQQRFLVSTLTVVSMGLGVALVVAVLVVYGVVYQSFHRGGEGYDLIVGAKGGREQLVLNTVFYLSQPVGNIPYDFFEELTIGKFAADVETAIPVCMGHTYQGFRVVGTVPEMFSELKYRGDKSYEFAQGENFEAENHFDGVLGATAAAQTKLQIGETFQAVHGSGIGGRTHKQTFTVVGILAPTGTPVDRAVFVNMYGFHDIHHAESLISGEESEHHDGDDHHEHSDQIKEITAALVCIRQLPPGRTDVVARAINNGQAAQAVVPVRVIADLFEGVVGKLQWILLGMAVLTTAVAGIGIMVSIYNSMSDRRHEIAVMRALGASRITVMLIILMESILLALMGGALGLLLGHGAIWACSSLIAEWTGVVVGLLQFQTIELILVPGLILLAAAVGYLPALAAYRTDVSKSLITTP
ncbi:MAG: FtsX-like permease family protein [Planctomycetes bacterium]|nr:FtsX-like permease family protein [Planctomycetota bacterium]MBU4400673.1 FtsX-like permease family protein [Planctomycetota bacterium]MCG2682694.1 ABC transporter permease [Planctomycetales bacterium]